MSVENEDQRIDLTHALDEFSRALDATGMLDCTDDEEGEGESEQPVAADWESIGLLPSWEKFQVVFRNAQYHFMAGMRRQDPNAVENGEGENASENASEKTVKSQSKDGGDGEGEGDDDDDIENRNRNRDRDVEGDETDFSDDEDWENIGRLPTLNQLQYTLRSATSMMNPSDLLAKYGWQNLTHNFTNRGGDKHEAEPVCEVSPEEFEKLCLDDGITEEEKLIHFNEEGLTGCPHYLRNCKSACSVCDKFYMCQICHDEKENHEMDRTQTTRMLCLSCKRPQPAARECHFCSEVMGDYYCSKCKLWSDDPDKPIYHCDKCGICRVGRGIGIDVFHCDTCGICMSLVVENNHRCIEQAANSGCPICLDNLFSSTRPVVFMPCGHPIHSDCFNDYSKRFYRCPLCSKSIFNTSALFRMIDEEVQSEVLPPELEDQDIYILCQDCRLKSRTKFHLAGLKCDTCGSYNTAKL